MEINRLKVEELLKSDIKSLTKYFNDGLDGFNYTSIEPSDVRGQMLSVIRASLPTDIAYNSVRATKTTGNDVEIEIGELILNVKLSVKNTGDIKKVTKLRSKHVKTCGKFKIDKVIVDTYMPSFELIKKGGLLLTSTNWGSRNPEINFDKSDLTFEEMRYTKNLIKGLNEAFKVEQERKSSEPKDILEALKISMIQPIMKPMLLDKSMRGTLGGPKFPKEKISDYIPEPYFSQLDEEVIRDDLFDIVKDFVFEANKENIDKYINQIFNHLLWK